MKSILNITNGDSAVSLMRQADLSGDCLPWRDVLHEGPVPKGLSLEELSEVRAGYIVSQGWGDIEEIKESFRQRDQALKSFDDYEEILLWFEHDLYDQLQILQILDWFSQQNNLDGRLSMICTDNYLGLLNSDQIRNLLRYKQNVTNAQLMLARDAWAAFCNDSPEHWGKLLEHDTSHLPYLDGAVLRLMQEYPSTRNGLSQTVQRALEIVANGERLPGKIFAKYQKTQERHFLGDSSFWNILNDLLGANQPLMRLSTGKNLNFPFNAEQQLEITEMGGDVLAGKVDWLQIKPINRWIGGVHLLPTNIWRWDEGSKILVS